MKKYAFVILAVAVMAACQKEEGFVAEKPQENVELQGGGYTLTVEATKEIPCQAGNDGETKALSLDGSKLNAYWKDGERVAVFLGGTYLGQLTATAGAPNTKATLSGVLNSVGGVNAGDALTLLFPQKDWDYTGQNGAAPSETGPLATQYDYATASVTVKSVDTSAKTITVNSAVAFQNQQSIYRFGFKVGGAGDAISVKSFTVSSTHNALVRSRSWETDHWTDTYGSISVNAATSFTLPYVSLRNTLVDPSNPNDDTTIDTYSFDVIGSDDALYLGSKNIPAQVMTSQGKFISAQSISIAKVELGQSNTNATEVW